METTLMILYTWMFLKMKVHVGPNNLYTNSAFQVLAKEIFGNFVRKKVEISAEDTYNKVLRFLFIFSTCVCINFDMCTMQNK